jgi:hypothetical protein
MNWDTEALNLIKNAAIEAYDKAGIILEIDERPHSPQSPLEKATSPSPKNPSGSTIVECRRIDFGAVRWGRFERITEPMRR